MLGRLIRVYVRRHVSRILLAALCMLVAAATTALNAWILEPVFDEVFLGGKEDMLVLIPLAVIAIAVIKGFATFAQAYLMSTVGQSVIAALQGDLFAHLMRADLAYFHRVTTGKLISNFLNDVQHLQEMLGRALTGTAKDGVTLVFLVGLLFYQDWRLAIVSCIVFPIAIVPIRNLGRRMRKASTRTQLATGRFSALLNETMQDVRHVKAYGMEAYETRRAYDVIADRLREMFRVVRTRALATPFVEVLSGIAIGGVIFYGGTRIVAGETSPGTFVSFLGALLMSYQPLRSLANLNTVLQEGLAAAQRIFAHIDVEPEIGDRPDAVALPVGAGAIAFDDVRFTYANGKAALNGVSLEVPAGATVGLVGRSGAGKSTVINLLPRFFDVDAGSIAIDGVDLRHATLASLRGAIGLVSQESTLFNDTVRANIAYGRIDADEREIERAARDAAAHDFIVELPRGYDTVVGERGVALSGGQRQRIAIARAMLKNAPILLLDEATSALDAESERQVQQALNNLMRGRTTLVVAHRLSSIQDADRIYVMDEGRIVETGRHGELLARGGVYAELYATQQTVDLAGAEPVPASG
ncbi:MAG: ATP-binding cassette domain-containing protein [Alphaproteobacteria bacterium]|nr:ATP-binding cassette domain-containing protein [Alphaproteobacteria bacterium]